MLPAWMGGKTGNQIPKEMKLYCTEIKAIDPVDGELKTYGGPRIPAISFQDAEDYCHNNGLGYCRVIGVLMAVIPTKEDGITPDWENRIDYSNDN